MKREELIKSKEFWLVQIQNNVFNLINNFKKEKKVNQSEIASHMGVTKGYVSQILNGDYDHKVSKLVDLALCFNKAPIINFIDIDKYIQDDKEGKNSLSNPNPIAINYWLSINSNTVLKIEPSDNNQFGQIFDNYFNSLNTVELSNEQQNSQESPNYLNMLK